jgi:hypothetical protein
MLVRFKNVVDLFSRGEVKVLTADMTFGTIFP